MSIASLAGQLFGPHNYVPVATFTPDFTQPNGTVAAGGVVTIPDPGGAFSNADDGQPDGYLILSVDTTAATSYRLGTAMVQNLVPGGGNIGAPFAVDIIGDNTAGQVILAIPPYDPTQQFGTFYNTGYFLVSNGNIDHPTFPLKFEFNANDYNAPCFVRGTLIATPSGEIAVEALVAGDLVLTVSGGTAPLVWAGHRRVDIGRHPRPDEVRPVRLSAGALAENVPARDLTVSPDHNLFLEGVLIPAKCLVNGSTVVQLDVSSVTYHHIELAAHDLVLAEGTPAETYLDTGNRGSFANAAVLDAHPDFATAPDLNFFAWESKGCARLVLSGPELDQARETIASRAHLLATATAAETLAA